MRRGRRVRGTTLVELIVGTGLGLLVLGACVGALAGAGRLLAAVGGRAEAEDTAQLAVEAFRFDVRRAGFDPAAAGVRARGPRRGAPARAHNPPPPRRRAAAAERRRGGDAGRRWPLRPATAVARHRRAV